MDIRTIARTELVNWVFQLYGYRTGIKEILDDRRILLWVRDENGEFTFRTIDIFQELERINGVILVDLKMKEEVCVLL